jgi:hypothetical protein
MRTYPRNSPEAAARIVTLVLLADGHMCPLESKELTSGDLGLQADQLSHVVQGVCEDLLMDGYAGRSMATIDDGLIASLTAEVDDLRLRHKVLRIASAAAQADGHLGETECVVLEATRRHWGLQRQETEVPAHMHVGLCRTSAGTHPRTEARI